MLILFIGFYLNTLNNNFPEKIPLNLFNSLSTPLFYEDFVNDFSPNTYYQKVLNNIFEPDSEKIISRFLLFRGPLSTEENSLRFFLPLLKNYLNIGFSFNLFKSKFQTPNFTYHKYYFTIFSTHLPFSFKFLQTDFNYKNQLTKIKKFTVSFTPLSFRFFYSRESGNYIKEKFSAGIENYLGNFYYYLSYNLYKFYLQDRRFLRNFNINLKFPFKFYLNIETGIESKDGERYSISGGFIYRFLNIYFFQDKKLFPFPFDTLRDTLSYIKPVRKKGLGFSLNFKNNLLSSRLKISYSKLKDMLFVDPLELIPSLYTGELVSVMTCDTINLFKYLKLNLKYIYYGGDNLNYSFFDGGVNLFLIKKEEKNYFIYAFFKFSAFNSNYIYRMGIEADFYSYLFVSFKFTQPSGGNFFYPEGYIPFSYYTITIKANIPD